MTTANGSNDPFWDGLVAKYGVGLDAPFDQDIAERRLEVGGDAPIEQDVLLGMVRQVTGVQLGAGELGRSPAVAGPQLTRLPVARPRLSPVARISMWIGGVAAAAVVAAVMASPLWDGRDSKELAWIDAMVVVADAQEPLAQRNGAIVRVAGLAFDAIETLRAVAASGDEEMVAQARLRLAALQAVAFGSSDPIGLPDDASSYADLNAGVTAEAQVLASGTSSQAERLRALTHLAAIASQSIHQLRVVELVDDPVRDTRRVFVERLQAALAD